MNLFLTGSKSGVFCYYKAMGKEWIKGQVTLPVIILISGIVIEIAVAGSFIAYFLSNEGLGGRLSARAEVAAFSGVNDALIKITRDKEFKNNSCSDPFSYDLLIDKDEANIKVCREDNGNAYIYTVTVLGEAANRQKKFIGTVIVDKLTGKVELKSIIEAPIS